MIYESAPRYELNPDDQLTLDYPIQERTIPLEERSLAQLGDLVLLTVIGGALAGGGLMPRTEAIAIEGLAAATEVPERIM